MLPLRRLTRNCDSQVGGATLKEGVSDLKLCQNLLELLDFVGLTGRTAR